MKNPEYIFGSIALIFDIDGVLVEPGTLNVPEEVKMLLLYTPEFFVTVASGRSLGWCWTIGEQIQSSGVFAENGLVFQFHKGEMSKDWQISRVLKTDINTLKELLELKTIEGTHGRITIRIGNQEYSIFVEVGKKEVLTLGTLEVERWNNEGHSLTPQELKEKCAAIISKNKLRIGILGPYSDGHIDFQPVADDGQLLDKRIIPGILKFTFPKKFKKIVALVDGQNDISLALQPDVFPVTFANGIDAIKQIVAARKGLIIDAPGYAGGCAEALRILRKNLLGITSLDLQEINASTILL